MSVNICNYYYYKWREWIVFLEDLAIYNSDQVVNKSARGRYYSTTNGEAFLQFVDYGTGIFKKRYR